jgi:adenylyltransferase/sulfurtransferase
VPVSPEWLSRQALQLPVPGFSEGMERLASARLRVVGAGAMAAPALLTLSRAGFTRIWVEDDAPCDEPNGWLGEHPGLSRAAAACQVLSSYSSLLEVERYPAGGVPTATLVCVNSSAAATAMAEQARRAGVPHVVMEPRGDGGTVVSVPPGAPCYVCSRTPSMESWPLSPLCAPLACIAAVEVFLAVLNPHPRAGRRVELSGGGLTYLPTVRRAACACGQPVRR